MTIQPTEPESTPDEVDLFKGLPSDRDVIARAYRSDEGPVGIHLEPAIAGWVTADSIDEHAFLRRRSGLEDVDLSNLERSKIRIIGGTAALDLSETTAGHTPPED
jgi:hypothetical protein